MSDPSYKSFSYQFNPLDHISLTNDIYEKMELVLKDQRPFWLHFEGPSKNLQQQLIKRFNMPKAVRLALFSEEARSRCLKFESGCLLIMQGVEPSTMVGNDNFPTIRFWITSQGILSLSTGKIKAVHELQLAIKTMQDPMPVSCLINLLEDLIFSLEDSIYHIDEELSKIEAKFEYTEEAAIRITALRQDIIYLRRYIFPQRDALIVLSNKLENISDSEKGSLKELSDGMLRQVEAIEMQRERAMIIQDSLTNQIGETANRRMYVLTVIMLIFTPAFFIMSMFSMYLPIPGMNSKFTWWVLVVLMFVISAGLLVLFRKKRWL